MSTRGAYEMEELRKDKQMAALEKQLSQLEAKKLQAQKDLIKIQDQIWEYSKEIAAVERAIQQI
jgi:septal ring factor EnvC (AmiA/AmiB activator)